MRNLTTRLAVVAAMAVPLGVVAGLASPALASETGTVCSGNSGAMKISPGVEETVAKVQNIKIKGVLTGCSGSTLTSATYVAHLKTVGPVTCATLATGESASGTIVVKWSPKGQKNSHGSLEMVLASGATTMYGSIGLGTFEGDGIYSPGSTVLGSCGDKKAKLKLGSFSSSELRVAAPPKATIEAPENGGVYTQNAVVPTSFSCAEGLFGPGLESCIDSNGASEGVGALDTSTLGEQSYSVTARSIDGQKHKDSIHYEVIE